MGAGMGAGIITSFFRLHAYQHETKLVFS